MSSTITSNNQCCCMHILTCAKIIVILGFIGSALSLTSAIFAWYYLPAAILSIFIYTFILIGLQKQRPDYLLPALAIFGLNIILNLLIFILFIVFGSIVPELRLAYFILAGIIFLINIYSIFAFIVIYRTRNYLISISQSSQNIEDAFSNRPSSNSGTFGKNLNN